MARVLLDQLTKEYGGVPAVDRLSLSLESGSLTGFIGGNGAGKSTTIRMLLGLTRPTSGAATIEGRAYRELAVPAREVGALTDPDVFHPGRTGRRALQVLAAYSGISPTRVEQVLDDVGLQESADRRVRGYSMGMRQRLALAGALLGDPETLILDEPANGLDPVGVHWLRTLLRRLASEGRTVLVSSHLLAELGQTVDDIAVIDAGRLVVHGRTADLMTTSGADSLEDLYLTLLTNGPQR